MRSALVLGFGQIGTQITCDLAAVGTHVRVMTRSRPTGIAAVEAAEDGRVTWCQGDASSARSVRRAAEEVGAEAIFACVHTAYDSRVWARTLPGLEAAIMDAAAWLGIPVVFPESVYAFAGLTSPITAASPFAPVEEKGRIRQRLLEARSAHPAQVSSVLAGDLIGRTASPTSSVVRLCIVDRIAAGRRVLVPARTDVPHGLTVIADLAAAMIEAASAVDTATDLDAAGRNRDRAVLGAGARASSACAVAGDHRLVIAPSANPTLAEVAACTHELTGTPHRTPVALPHAVVRASGWFDRSMFELAELAPIWRRPCLIDSGGAEPDWRAGIDAMLR